MAFLWMWENMILFKWFCPLFDLTQVFSRLMTLKLRSQDDVDNGIVWYSMSNKWICGLPLSLQELHWIHLQEWWFWLSFSAWHQCLHCRDLWLLEVLWVPLPMLCIPQMETSPTLPAHLPRCRQRWECFRCYEGIPSPLAGTARQNFWLWHQQLRSRLMTLQAVVLVANMCGSTKSKPFCDNHIGVFKPSRNLFRAFRWRWYIGFLF